MYCYRALVKGFTFSPAIILHLNIDLGFGIYTNKKVVLYNVYLKNYNEKEKIFEHVKEGDLIKIKVVRHDKEEIYYPHVLAYNVFERELNKLLIEKGIAEEYE